MTDRTLIYKFLKNFDIKINDNEFIIFDKKINQEFKNYDFSKLFLIIFDEYKTDDNRLPFEICQEWFDKKKKKYTKDIDKYLSDCIIKLGNTDWVVYKSDGTIVTYEDVKKIFGNKFGKTFLYNYYNRWYTDNVINESEKIMNVF